MSRMKILAILVAGVLLFTGAIAQAGTISVQTTPSGAQSIPGLVGSTVINFEGVTAGTYSTLTLSGLEPDLGGWQLCRGLQHLWPVAAQQL